MVRAPLLKVWDLEKGEKSGIGMGAPVLPRSIKVQTGNDCILYVVDVHLWERDTVFVEVRCGAG